MRARFPQGESHRWFMLTRIRLNSLKFYKAAHQLRFSFDTSNFVFPLCAHIHLVRDLFLMLDRPSGTVSVAKLDHQTHSFKSFSKSHLSKLSCWLSVSVCVSVCMHTWACTSLFWLMMKWCLMSSDVGWHIRDKQTNAEAWFNKSLRPRKPEGSLGRTAQDGHLDSHTAPELWFVLTVLVLCFVVGYVLHFGEIAHKRVHYYYCNNDVIMMMMCRLQKEFQANPESYNGAVRDNYSWSQSITDTDVRVKVSQPGWG